MLPSILFFKNQVNLILVSYSGNISIVKFLLDVGSSVNACDQDGWTSLHYAAQRGQRDIVEAILSKRANVDARNNAGQTPIDLARKYDHLGIIDLLSSSPLQVQSYEKQQRTFLYLLKFISHHFPHITIDSVKQGLYIPSFEVRKAAMNGKCAAITRGFSQILFLQQQNNLLDQKLHKLFLNNLQTSAELYERIAQGKQISAREEREIFDLSKLLDGFEQQLDSPTSSLPSTLSQLQNT